MICVYITIHVPVYVLNNSTISCLYKATEKVDGAYSKQVLFTYSDQGLPVSKRYDK